MITINNYELRNLEEQVQKNKNDISAIVEGNIVLGELGIKVVGQDLTIHNLPDPLTYAGDYGDAFLIGEEPPYDFYIFTRPFPNNPEPQWFNLGKFPVAGPQGAQGIQGIQGPQGTPGNTWTVGIGIPTFRTNTGNMYLNSANGTIYQYTGNAWQNAGTFSGPAGPIGPQGIQGPQGPQGEQGPQGPQGIPAPPVSILGELNSVSELPNPTAVDRSAGYLINGDLYIIVGTTNLSWLSLGVFSPAGTTVTSNGQVLSVFNADTKVNIINSTSKVYTTEGAVSYSVNKTGSTIPVRKTDGTITVNTPSSTDDAVNLGYLNNQLTNYVPKSTQENTVYGSTTNYTVNSSAISNTISLRTGTGTIKAATPTESDDLTTKDYVDTAISNIPSGGGGSQTLYRHDFMVTRKNTTDPQFILGFTLISSYSSSCTTTSAIYNNLHPPYLQIPATGTIVSGSTVTPVFAVGLKQGTIHAYTYPDASITSESFLSNILTISDSVTQIQ